jgi:peptidoglycan/xylan/chitin deacetylase (PgdA/CDA1 family)
MAELKTTLKRTALRVCGNLIPNQYRPPGGVLFPYGHAVADTSPLHVKHLFPVPGPAKFQSDLDFLCRKLSPLEVSALEQVPAQYAAKASPRSFILSFDDGLREVHEVIAPMLSRQGIPAIFFINSAVIDNKRLMWRNKISLLIERSRKLPGRIPPQVSLRANESLQDRLRGLRFADEDLIDDIARFFEVDFNDYLRTARPYLTTDQVLALSRAGFAVGAHSDRHAYFQEMTVEEQKNEISTCVGFIRKLGLPCRYFAFPFHDEGIPIPVFNHMKELGVALSFGTSGACVDSVGFSFQRFSIEALDFSVPQVLKQLSAKSVLRQLSRTEVIQRSS